jgi:hypothetical protein
MFNGTVLGANPLPPYPCASPTTPTIPTILPILKILTIQIQTKKTQNTHHEISLRTATILGVAGALPAQSFRKKIKIFLFLT